MNQRGTERFLSWIRQYSGWWELICTPNAEKMNLQLMRMLIQRLADEELYDLIFVLLNVHRHEPFMKDFRESLLLDFITEKWENEKDDMIKKMIYHLE